MTSSARVGAALALAAACSVAAAEDAEIAAAPLPLATRRVPASAAECSVWRREQSFARSVERHDARAFAEHVHVGAVFDAGTVGATRGRDAITASWAPIVAGTAVALRWRPGIVQIAGDPGVAVSRGPYILQRAQGGADVVRVGLYQTVWLRDANDGAWRVLFDGSASAGQTVESREAAERWVAEQAMSDCAP